MSNRAAYSLVAALCLLACAIAFHACKTSKGMASNGRDVRSLEAAVREATQAIGGELFIPPQP